MFNEYHHQLAYFGMDSAFNQQHQPLPKTHWGISDPDLRNKPDWKLTFQQARSSNISITHYQLILTSPAIITLIYVHLPTILRDAVKHRIRN